MRKSLVSIAALASFSTLMQSCGVNAAPRALTWPWKASLYLDYDKNTKKYSFKLAT